LLLLTASFDFLANRTSVLDQTTNTQTVSEKDLPPVGASSEDPDPGITPPSEVRDRQREIVFAGYVVSALLLLFSLVVSLGVL